MSMTMEQPGQAGCVITDAKVLAVLDAYHARQEGERAARRADPDAIRQPGWRDTQLLTVGAEAGAFLNLLVKSLKAPRILEIGTSYGYSAIWLGEAARASGGHLTTLELHDYKAQEARAQLRAAGLDTHVDVVVGDAIDLIGGMEGGFDFILLDLWKDLYVPCLDVFYPKLNPGAIVAADNMIVPGGEGVEAYGRAVRARPGMRSVLLPIGQGIEISRFDGA